jgi:phage baseplate assembly protein gpV
MSTHIPSIDPADEGDLLGALRHILGKEIQNLDGMLPAKVVSFDRATNRVTVQPLVMVLTTSNTTLSRATIASLPVYQIGGGGFILNFNLKAGDLGWIQANDRDISLFLQEYKEAGINTLRKHSFSDAVFYPDVMTGYTIASEDAENAVLQNLDGTVRISLWPDKVKVTAPTVEIDSPTTHITGALNVDGAITSLSTIDGTTITGSVDVIAGTISGKTHVHSDPQGGLTGVPQ